MIADFFKQYYSRGTKAPLYYWRDTNGRIEVDCLIDQGTSLTVVEIKSNEIVSKSYFDNLIKFNEISETQPSKNFVIYGGIDQQTRSSGNVVGWQAAGSLINKLEE